MKSLKGFVSISTLINNVPGVNSPIGEISTQSLTFAQDVQKIFIEDTGVQYILNVFSSKETTNNTYVAPNSLVNATIVELIKNAIIYSNGHTQPFSKTNWLQYINGLLNSKITDLQIGDFQANSDGSVSLPKWFSFSSLEVSNQIVKIWLSDSSFQLEYDEYSIIPTLPFEDMDIFFTLPYADIVSQKNNINYDTLLSNVYSNQDGLPSTKIKMIHFDFDPTNPSQSNVSIPFYVSIYSNYGDNIESIREAICDNILANSTRTRSQWTAIFPTLFKQTKYYLFPRWDLISMPDLSVQNGLYSVITTPTEMLSYVEALLPSLGNTFVQNNLQAITSTYKYLSIGVVGGLDNINSKFKFSDVFPDYMPVPTNSLDFNRMTLDTQNWVMLLLNLLMSAESTVTTLQLFPGMRKLTIEGNDYIVADYDNIEYLVYAKSN